MILQKVQGVLIPFDPEAQEEIERLPTGKPLKCKVSQGNATDQQRKALFVWCAKIAKAFNDGGITRSVTIGNLDIDTDWDKDSVYKDIWCQIQKIVVGTDSIRTLEKAQLDQVYSIINRDVLMPQGVYEPFPSWDHGIEYEERDV